MSPEDKVGGFVLAGGLSSRMGHNKALLEWGGSALVERAAELMTDAVGSAAIVGDPAKYARFGYQAFADLIPGCGPLGGIHAALSASPFDWNLIAVCDMPNLTAIALRTIAGWRLNATTHHAVLPVVDGRPEPLCALYNKQALPGIEEALASGVWKITAALAALDVLYIDSGDTGLFRNINTPSEWSALLAETPAGY